MQNILEKLKNKLDLNEEESYKMQTMIIGGGVSKDDIIEIFKMFEEKNITDQEMIGIVDATRDNMNKVKVDFNCLDNCGTGGDGLNTFNISTASAVVCAAAGVPMAKHGNRASSSKCGSADVLANLGVKIELNSEQAKECLERAGIVFMFAPLFHPALKYVKEARIEYGKRTYFNILGPMLNPASAKYQLIGVADISKANLIGETLIKTGSKKAMIVGGAEGLDEISPVGDSQVMIFSQEGIEKTTINPSKFGLEKYSIEELRGGNAKENAKIFMDILENKATKAQLNAVLLNAAAAMYVFGKVNNIAEGLNLARKTITSGKAIEKLNEFIKISNEV